MFTLLCEWDSNPKIHSIPFLSLALISSPLPRSNCKQAGFSAPAARWRGVAPSLSTTFIWALFSKSRFIMRSFELLAAKCKPVWSSLSVALISISPCFYWEKKSTSSDQNNLSLYRNNLLCNGMTVSVSVCVCDWICCIISFSEQYEHFSNTTQQEEYIQNSTLHEMAWHRRYLFVLYWLPWIWKNCHWNCIWNLIVSKWKEMYNHFINKEFGTVPTTKTASRSFVQRSCIFWFG